MSSKLKDWIIRFDPKMETLLKAVADCPKGQTLNLCNVSGKENSNRRLSEYQVFTSKCLREKHLTKFDPSALKDCAAQWRQRKQS